MRRVNAAEEALAVGPTMDLDADTAQPAVYRNRVRVPKEVVDQELKLATEGKVSSRNAWELQLLEGMQDTVQSCLADRSDHYAQFSKVGNIVEGGAKVWTHRVESTYLLSTQMVRRLLRNEKDSGGDESGTQGAAGGDEAAATQGETRRNKRRAMERTLADTVAEINLDAKTIAAGSGNTVSPLFRAMTEKFDQGHSQGLLMNNAPFGTFGNVILEQDYSKAAIAAIGGNVNLLAAGTTAVTQQTNVGTPMRGSAGALSVSSPDAAAAAGEDEESSPLQRRQRSITQQQQISAASTAALDMAASQEEADEFMIPDATTPLSTNADGGSITMLSSVAPMLGGNGFAATISATGRTSIGSHASLATAATGLGGALGQRRGGGATASLFSAFEAERQDREEFMIEVDAQSPRASSQLRRPSQTKSDDNDDDVAGDGGGFTDDYYDDDDGMNGDNDDDDARGGPEDEYYRDRSPVRSRLGSIARGMVSGASDLSTLHASDTQLFQGNDTNSWLPTLSQQAVDVQGKKGFSKDKLSGMASEIRKRCAIGGMFESNDENSEEDGTANGTAAKKRTRTEASKTANKKVLISEGLQSQHEQQEENGVDLSEIESLKQAKNPFMLLTPLGKEWHQKDTVVGLQYTQDANYCLERAKKNGLVLPQTVGVEFPTWMIRDPSVVKEFFQPFSVQTSHWNMLQKSSRAAYHHGGFGATAAISRIEENGDVVEDVVAEMPMDLFDANDDYDDGDDGDFQGFSGRPSGADAGGRPSHLSLFSGAGRPSFGLDGEAKNTEFGSLLEFDHDQNVELVDLPEMISALKVKTATAPTQVDVVRLRKVMWDKTQEVFGLSESELKDRLSADGAALMDMPLKHSKHSQRVGSGRKRGRDDEGDQDEDDDEEEDEKYHKFSEVVAKMIPHIRTISKDGTLSPAFFFFSILFLANEHSILLETDLSDVSDLLIKGFAGRSQLAVKA